MENKSSTTSSQSSYENNTNDNSKDGFSWTVLVKTILYTTSILLFIIGILVFIAQKNYCESNFNRSNFLLYTYYYIKSRYFIFASFIPLLLTIFPNKINLQDLYNKKLFTIWQKSSGWFYSILLFGIIIILVNGSFKTCMNLPSNWKTNNIKSLILFSIGNKNIEEQLAFEFDHYMNTNLKNNIKTHQINRNSMFPKPKALVNHKYIIQNLFTGNFTKLKNTPYVFLYSTLDTNQLNLVRIIGKNYEHLISDKTDIGSIEDSYLLNLLYDEIETNISDKTSFISKILLIQGCLIAGEKKEAAKFYYELKSSNSFKEYIDCENPNDIAEWGKIMQLLKFAASDSIEEVTYLNDIHGKKDSTNIYYKRLKSLLETKKIVIKIKTESQFDQNYIVYEKSQDDRTKQKINTYYEDNFIYLSIVYNMYYYLCAKNKLQYELLLKKGKIPIDSIKISAIITDKLDTIIFEKK